MSRPKQQHYVPQVYLKNFCTVKNNKQLYFYDKSSKKSALTNITNIAQEKDFYSDISQENRDYYEKFYSSNLEPVLGKLLNRIISTATLCNAKTPLLIDNDRSTLSKMIVYQMLRTRSARNFMREKADIVSESLITRLLNDPTFNQRKDLRELAKKYRVLDEDTFKELTLPLTIDEERMQRYVKILDSMKCTFYDNQTKERFITSDNPIIIIRSSTHDIGLGKAGLGFIDCMIIYPINPRLAAVLVHNNSLFSFGYEKIINRKCPIKQIEVVHSLNRLQLLQASRQIYSQTEFNQ